MFGRQARLPTDVAFSTASAPAVAVPQCVAQLQESLHFSYARVQEQMGHQLQKQNVHCDARTEATCLKTVTGCGCTIQKGIWEATPTLDWPTQGGKQLSDAVYNLQDVQYPRYIQASGALQRLETVL